MAANNDYQKHSLGLSHKRPFIYLCFEVIVEELSQV